MKIILIYFLLFFSLLQAREIGQTEITTEEGIEVYQKEKYYLLKKNVQIVSDNFNLTAQLVKAYFDKDLYDITIIYSEGEVVIKSNNGLNVIGNKVDYDVIKEEITIKGKDSFLENESFTMKSDERIFLDNSTGTFELYGLNSELISKDIKIKGMDIKGEYSNINGENVVDILKVNDDTQSNITTETSNMFAKRAEYNKKDNIIELFENVKIFRNNEFVTGDYAKINTLDESYFVETNESKRVKILLNQE